MDSMSVGDQAANRTASTRTHRLATYHAGPALNLATA